MILSLGMLNCSTTNNAEVGLIHSNERSPDIGSVFGQSWGPGRPARAFSMLSLITVYLLPGDYVKTAWHDGRTQSLETHSLGLECTLTGHERSEKLLKYLTCICCRWTCEINDCVKAPTTVSGS